MNNQNFSLSSLYIIGVSLERQCAYLREEIAHADPKTHWVKTYNEMLENVSEVLEGVNAYIDVLTDSDERGGSLQTYISRELGETR